MNMGLSVESTNEWFSLEVNLLTIYLTTEFKPLLDHSLYFSDSGLLKSQASQHVCFHDRDCKAHWPI